ncbi:hypothetical protein CDL15_Pgr027033 [Punica granatum]|uniref:Uncharacterized protein n=1 Tax=Punica granatum TaxID=22663 RepID=A0A218XQL7_PUNGR|nr:hypothetical protein CDL15_Pgr027033 [Punica granatum]
MCLTHVGIKEKYHIDRKDHEQISKISDGQVVPWTVGHNLAPSASSALAKQGGVQETLSSLPLLPHAISLLPLQLPSNHPLSFSFFFTARNVAQGTDRRLDQLFCPLALYYTQRSRLHQFKLPPLGSATDVANPEPSRRCYFWSPLCKSLVTALLLLVAAAELLVTTAFLQGTVAELSIVATPMLVVATSMLVTTTFLQVTTTFLLVTATFLQVIAMPSLVIATVGVHVAAALSRNSPGPRDLKSHLRV